MTHAIKKQVTIKPGGVVEFQHPDLPAGAVVEVIVLVELVEKPADEPPSLTSLIGSTKGLFGSAEEADAYLRQERDSWDS